VTISFRAAAGLTAGIDTSAPWTLPTGHTLDDFLLAVYGGKQYDASVTSGTFTTDYASLTDHANGTTVTGNGTGSLRLQCAWRQHDGSESAPAGTVSATPSIRMTSMAAFSKTTAGTWDVAATDGDDTTATSTTISSTGGSLSFAPGDMLVWICAGPDDFTISGSSMTVPGCTLSGLTNALGTTTTTTGDDGMMRIYYATISTGTVSAAPTFSAATSAGGSGNSTVAATFIRLREPSVTAPPRPYTQAPRLQYQAPRRSSHY
jgi:hypothetical protein